jgi:hypothetical protein
MIPIPAAFSGSYAEARTKFLEGAASLGLRIHSHLHPLKGRDGETLAMDVVRDGPADADRLLIVSSACHGVEGYCGSGVQVAALADAEWREKARAQGVAVLYIHALNPYGFSHIRRVTQENVDLNRNFHDFSQALPVNTAYRDVQPLLLPEYWPPGPENLAATAAFIAERGMPAFQAAVSGGQHEFPDGLFFGGTAPTWSNQTVRTVLRQHAAGVKRLGWIDLHTGLGPSGHGERIFAARDDAATLARARAWWASSCLLGVRAALDDAARVHHQNLVRIHHGGQAVRNHQRGLALRGALQLGLDGALVGRVQRRGGLVEDQDRRVLQQGAGNGHALLFAARELEAALAHHGGRSPWAWRR